jgi:hypothetical protein
MRQVFAHQCKLQRAETGTKYMLSEQGINSMLLLWHFWWPNWCTLKGNAARPANTSQGTYCDQIFNLWHISPSGILFFVFESKLLKFSAGVKRVSIFNRKNPSENEGHWRIRHRKALMFRLLPAIHHNHRNLVFDHAKFYYQGSIGGACGSSYCWNWISR